MFVSALLLSALLLTLLFESWAFTMSVIATVLLSASAVLFGLWTTGTELDISALMGLTMVVGMLTELAIFYLAELVPGAPVDARALLKAGAARLRPILMSALIAILTLLPLALELGRGSGLQRPLATAIIFGLALGAPLILTALPGMLLLLSRRLDTKRVHDDSAVALGLRRERHGDNDAEPRRLVGKADGAAMRCRHRCYLAEAQTVSRCGPAGLHPIEAAREVAVIGYRNTRPRVPHRKLRVVPA